MPEIVPTLLLFAIILPMLAFGLALAHVLYKEWRYDRSHKDGRESVSVRHPGRGAR